MFNPINIDEVCVQATHIEYKEKNAHNSFSSTEFNQSKEGKGKNKGKYTATVRKSDERSTCSHCQKQAHEEAKCWVSHL